MDRQIERWIDRKMDRQIERQIDRVRLEIMKIRDIEYKFQGQV